MIWTSVCDTGIPPELEQLLGRKAIELLFKRLECAILHIEFFRPKVVRLPHVDDYPSLDLYTLALQEHTKYHLLSKTGLSELVTTRGGRNLFLVATKETNSVHTM